MPRTENYYSEETHAILGKTPSWIIRWGITVVFSIFGGILLGCYFVKYPDVIKAPAIITTLNPPADLISRYDGLIDTLYVKDGEYVENGDIISVLHSATNWADINKLYNYLKDIAHYPLDHYTTNSWIFDNYQLGELQPAFSNLQSLIRKYKYYLETNHIEQKKQLLNQQIIKTKEYYHKLQQQREFLIKDLDYSRKAVQRDSLLLSAAVIAESDYETSIQGLLSKQNSKAGFDASLTSTELKMIQDEQQIIELSIQQQDDIAEYERQINESLQHFFSQITQWEQKYVLRAPSSGKISFMEFWSTSQHLKTGDKLASIIPLDNTEVIGRLQIPSSGFGKVAVGNIVNVQLNGYPYMEFGVLRGVIRALSAVPEQVSTSSGTQIIYLAEVIFPNGMVTTYNQELPMIQQMDGTAEIVTNDLRLIERFIQPIVSIFKN